MIILPALVFMSVLGVAAALVMTGHDLRAITAFIGTIVAAATVASVRVSLGAAVAAKTVG